MRQGGNEQIKRFFRKLEIENSPIKTLYCSKGANHYRERLKEKVGKIMSGELKSESRVLSKSNHHRNTKSQSAISDLMSSESGQKRRPSIYFYNVSFADGPMGMTISKDFGGRALVSKLVTGGAAECCGVRIGDHISGIAKKRVDDYDEIMHMIPCMTRPILIQFSRRTMGHHAPGTTTVNVEFASPGKNRSLHGSKSMASMSINTQTVEGASNKNKPKIRSPRQQPSLGVLDNIEEGDEDMFNSPKAGKLVSYRSKSKDSPEWSAAAKMNFSDDTPTSVLAMSAESSQTDANQCSSPAASLKGTSGHTTTVSAKSAVADVLLEEVPLETPRQSPRKGPAHPSVDEEFSITASTSREFPPLSLELCKQIDEMLISPVGSGSSKKMDFIVSNGQQPSSSEEVFSPHCDRLSDEHVLFAGEGSTRKLTLQVRIHFVFFANLLIPCSMSLYQHQYISHNILSAGDAN